MSFPGEADLAVAGAADLAVAGAADLGVEGLLSETTRGATFSLRVGRGDVGLGLLIDS